MLILMAIVCLLIGLGLLVWLSIVDLREWILPNELVLGFAACGIVFHLLTWGAIMTPMQMLYGMLAGGGTLLAIRTIANYVYKRDTVGLGDVKLMFAGGLWLGPYYIMVGLAAGAFIGLIIGLIFLALPHSHPEDIAPQEGDGLMQTSVPAGPGFCGGIAVAIIWMIHEWPNLFMAVDKLMTILMGLHL